MLTKLTVWAPEISVLILRLESWYCAEALRRSPRDGWEASLPPGVQELPLPMESFLFRAMAAAFSAAGVTVITTNLSLLLALDTASGPHSTLDFHAVCRCMSSGQSTCICGHCYWTTTACVFSCPEYPLLIFSSVHTPLVPRTSLTTHKFQGKIIKNFKIALVVTIWAWDTVLRRSHAHKVSPSLTRTVHEIYIPVEDTGDEQVNKDIFNKILVLCNEIL